MSEFIHILCRSSEAISASEIADLINDGAYFDKAPRFDPLPGTAEYEAHDWRTLAVCYQERKRPVIFHKSMDAPEVREQVREIIEEELADKQSAADALRRRLQCCCQTVAIEASMLASPTEEAWEMVDNVAAYLAQKYRGIVFVHGEGFFDWTRQAISLSDTGGGAPGWRRT